MRVVIILHIDNVGMLHMIIVFLCFVKINLTMFSNFDVLDKTL